MRHSTDELVQQEITKVGDHEEAEGQCAGREGSVDGVLNPAVIPVHLGVDPWGVGQGTLVTE